MFSWEEKTTTHIPEVEEYKTVKGLPDDVDKQVMSLIQNDWHVHGLPQAMNIQGTDILVQGMVKYKE